MQIRTGQGQKKEARILANPGLSKRGAKGEPSGGAFSRNSVTLRSLKSQRRTHERDRPRGGGGVGVA